MKASKGNEDDEGDEDVDSRHSPGRNHTTSMSLVESSRNVDLLTYQDIQITNTDESAYLIEHELSFNAPLYHQPKFQSLPLKQRVQILCSYHTHVVKNMTKYAKLQVESAPLPKLIGTSSKCVNSLRRHDEDSEDENSNNIKIPELSPKASEEYVSRSGRVTKRKLYSENVTFLPSEAKKFKVLDDEWQSSTKTPRSGGRGKKNSQDSDLNTSEHESVSRKNLDIMSRSALFRDKESNSRLLKIAEGVEQNKLQTAMEEKKIEAFQHTLDSGDEFIETIDLDSNNGTRKRVVPPTLKSKRGKGKAVAQSNDSERVKQRGKAKQKTDKNEETSQIQRKLSDSPKEEPTSSSSTSNRKVNAKMVCCPICEREFEKSEIEAHASSCGENVFPTRLHDSEPSSTTCPFCDKVFISTDEHTQHLGLCGSLQ